MLPSPLSSSITPSSSAGNWDTGRATPARLRAEPCKPPRLLQGRSASPAPSYPHLISHMETHYRLDGVFANAPSASAKGRKRKPHLGARKPSLAGRDEGTGWPVCISLMRGGGEGGPGPPKGPFAFSSLPVSLPSGGERFRPITPRQRA